MSEKVREWFLYKSVSDDSGTMTAVPRGNDPYDQYANMITVIEKTAFEYNQLAEIKKMLVEALERTQKILQAYSDVKVESPGSSPNEEYLAFKGYGMNKEVLEKAKEMGK